MSESQAQTAAQRMIGDAFYSGWPKPMSAIAVAKQVFSEE
jgi:alkylhydroperoxidase/carboxymuconolactone decarboxylase family protein YurZ